MVPSDVPHSSYSQPGVGSSMAMAPSGANAGALMPPTWDPDMLPNLSASWDPNMPRDNNMPTIHPDIVRLRDTAGNMATESQMQWESAIYQTPSPISECPELTPKSTSTWMQNTPMGQLESHEPCFMQRTQSMPKHQTYTLDSMPPTERHRSISGMGQFTSHGAMTGQQAPGPSQAQKLPMQRPMYNKPPQQPSRQHFPNDFQHAQPQTELPNNSRVANHYQQFQSPHISSRDNFHFQPHNNVQSFLESPYGNNSNDENCFEPQYMSLDTAFNQSVEQSSTPLSENSNRNHDHSPAPAMAQYPPRERFFVPQALSSAQSEAENSHQINHNITPRKRNYDRICDRSAARPMPSSPDVMDQDELRHGPLMITEPYQAIKDTFEYWEKTSPPSPSKNVMVHPSALLDVQHRGKHASVEEAETEPAAIVPAIVEQPSLPTMEDIRSRRTMLATRGVAPQVELREVLARAALRR